MKATKSLIDDRMEVEAQYDAECQALEAEAQAEFSYYSDAPEYLEDESYMEYQERVHGVVYGEWITIETEEDEEPEAIEESLEDLTFIELMLIRCVEIGGRAPAGVTKEELIGLIQAHRSF